MSKTKKTLSVPIFSAIYWSVAALCTIVDQLTKYFIYDKLMGGAEHRHLDVIGKFVVFDTILNEGATMGLNLPDIVLFFATIVGLPLFVWLMYRSRTRSVWGRIAFSIMLGGTVGNFIDRFYVASEGAFFSGKVRDFIHFDFSAIGLTDFFPYSFNIADSCLVVGVIMALLAIVFFDDDSLIKTLKEEKKAAQPSAAQSDVEQPVEPSEQNIVTEQNDTTESNEESDENDPS